MRTIGRVLHIMSTVCVIVLLWARPAMAQGHTCSDAEVNRTVAAVGMARQELLALPIGDGLDTNVSTEARRAVGLMKSSLNDMVAAYMQCVPTSAQPDPKRIEKDLSALVHAFRLPAGFIKNEDLPKDFGKCGFELSFEVRATKDARRLVSITATFAIECGSDTMLLIFSPSGNFWKEVLRWQSPPYDTVAGAFGAFDYRISAADPSGRWYIVAKSIRPWCSSTWSNIGYAVLRPVPDNSTPRVLLSGSDSIWWGNEDFGARL